MTKHDHERDRETLAKDRVDKAPPAQEIGGDETGATTGVNPGEQPIVPEDKVSGSHHQSVPGGQEPVGNDPTAPGGGHGEGP
jgi:hypothetical protein